jgi:hypothetical protein
MNYLNEIQELLKPLPHRLQVRFALDCALDVKHLMTPEAIQALDVAEKWLKGEATQYEVEAATTAARAAYYAAAYHAARADYAARAAYHAAATAARADYRAAYYSARAAYGASYAAAYAAANAGNNKDKKIKEYYENLKGMILNMSELEKLVYNTEI